MKSVTLNIVIRGDTYSELIYLAEQYLSDFLEIDIEEIEKIVQYELLVSEDLEEDTETSYTAKLIAKIKEG
jgi:hypothetical protein